MIHWSLARLLALASHLQLIFWSVRFRSLIPSDWVVGIVMPARHAYLDRVTTEVEEVASRVAELKGRFAKQRVSVKLDHYWELDFVRTRFAEFKRGIQQLEDAEDSELSRLQENVDAAWKDLMRAVDTLMAALH
jgi:hypothetical protein